MRIIYCGAFRFPTYDAASQRVLNNGRAMREYGHEVMYISWGGKYRDEDLGVDGNYYYDGFRYIITDELDCHKHLLRKLIFIWKRGKKTIELLGKTEFAPDVIILYNASYSWTHEMLSYCSRKKIKLVNDITEWYDHNELYFFQIIPNWFNMKFTQRRVKNKILISSYLNDVYSKSNNIIIPPLCDASNVKWGRKIEDSRINSFDGITLIYAGNPARKDAVHYVINAVQRLIDGGANIRFLIVGAEREQYLKNYADLLSIKGLSDRIQFLGRVPQDDVPSYYALADFMVLLRESTRKSNAGFPTKFAESFTSGTPVVANLTSDLGNYLKDSKTGFVVDEPTEVSIYRTLKEKVLPLKPNEIEEMKKNVRMFAKQLEYHAYIEPLRIFIANLK